MYLVRNEDGKNQFMKSLIHSSKPLTRSLTQKCTVYSLYSVEHLNFDNCFFIDYTGWHINNAIYMLNVDI